MKKNLILILVMFSQIIFGGNSFAQTQILFKKAIPDTNFSTGNPEVAVLGNQYFSVGIRTPKGYGTPGNVAVKKYSNGAVAIRDTVYSFASIMLSKITITSISGSIAVSYSDPLDSDNIKLFTFDNSLNATTPVTIGSVSGNDLDYAVGMRSLGNDLFVAGVCHSTDKIPALGFNAFVVKTDVAGNTAWTRFFEGFATNSVAPTPSGNSFAVVRSYDSLWNVIDKVYYLDFFGNTIWVSQLPSSFGVTDMCFDQKTGEVIVAMKEHAYTTLIGFVKIDLSGSQSPIHMIGRAGSVFKIEDSYAGFVVCGYFQNLTAGTGGAYAAEFDENFNLMWERKEFDGGKLFTGLAQRSNNLGWVFTGHTIRPYWPSSTADLNLTRLTYPALQNSINISGNVSMCAGDSLVLSTPYFANYTYAWKRYSQFVQGADSSSYTVTTLGKYKVFTTNEYGRTASSLVVDVVLDVNCRLALSESSGNDAVTEKKLVVYPNPATDRM